MASPYQTLSGKLMASLFYEPSTRTRFSFEAAMLRLGGCAISTENAGEFSSVTKGETLEDTIQIMSQYVDVIVLRHYEEGASARAAEVATVPIINAGDGPGQHPTQALLDLYTIYRELGGIDGKQVAVLGDLKYSRTIRSLVYLLGKYDDVTIHFISAPEFKVKPDIKEYLDRHDISYQEHTTLGNVLENVDVVYQTRMQKERFKEGENADHIIAQFCITESVADSMKESAIIMDPLPRVGGIDPRVDSNHRAVYFKQARYGMYVRMALLHAVLTNGNTILS